MKKGRVKVLKTVGKYTLNGDGMERRRALMYILGESISWLNIFVGIGQCLLKLNTNAC